MDRRLGGVLVVLGLVVAAAAIVAGRAPDPRADRAPGPDPPAVGDCFAPAGLTASVADQGTTGVRRFGSCDSRHVGEIVAVQHRPLPDAEIDIPAPSDCTAPMMAYAGLQASGTRFVLPGDDPQDPVAWTYSLAPDMNWFRQFPTLPAPASDWAACLVFTGRHDFDTSRLANAYGGGSLPVSLGSCGTAQGSPSLMLPIDCTLAHTAELLATGTVVDPATTGIDVVRASCARQAAQVIGDDDPTVGGQLTVSLSLNGRDPAAGSARVNCVLISADGRGIRGTLVGLHGRAIQFAH